MPTEKHLLLFGAGKSATVLIDYLKVLSVEKQWSVTVADVALPVAQSKVGDHAFVKAIQVDLNDAEERNALVATADLVISLLPPFLQLPVAEDCLEHGKHFLSASYTDPDIQLLAKSIEQKGILFLCEMGLDPGIDHMSAMKMIHAIETGGGKVISFRSHCGGLIAPESDDNPWHYKFSWNPRNVVLAGKAGAVFKQKNEVVKKTYTELFSDCGEIEVTGLGNFAFYPNRDSLGYMPVYGLNDTQTFIRTTLRDPAFCRGWDQVIALGLTNENDSIETDSLSVADFFQMHIRNSGTIIPESLQDQFVSIGLHDETLINKGACSSADILQWILEQKWALQENDKDMIVMLHEIGFVENESTDEKVLRSLLIVKGDDPLHTAMAKTVGLPLGIAARLVLEGVITETGLRIPISEGIYLPVLKALEEHGIVFREEKS